MDFELMCNEFINGTEIEEIIEKYNINYARLVKVIKLYFKMNNLEVNDLVAERLEKPVKNMYELKKQGMVYAEIAKKYNCSVEIVRDRVTKYCKKNNLEMPKHQVHKKYCQLMK